MAFQKKFTIKRGKPRIEEVAITNGSVEAQSDTISLNIDQTNMTKGECLLLIASLRDRVHATDWPPANT